NSSTADSEDSLLKRIAEEHDACTERRRNQERELVWRHDLPRISFTNEEVYLTNQEYVVEILRISVIESWKLLVAVFPSIGKWKTHDQCVFFRMCVPQFVLIDCLCRTRNIFCGSTKYAMCSVLACTDLESPKSLIGEDEGVPNREPLNESIRSYHQAQKALMTSFEKLDISQTQMYAFLALLLHHILVADSGNEEFTEHFQLFLGEIQCQIRGKLRRFYTKEMKMTDYSDRLENLLSLCHTLNESLALFPEYVRMHITIFDDFVTETLMNGLLF
ncbi:hypothetical protein PRIPAC_80045, partial [Pristionchus pacificus]|uniref:Nuclear receptor n=1 Tax=Pristionchus pacificus TaxID=54126 RepID=A0A2A6CQA2_PRIPA